MCSILKSEKGQSYNPVTKGRVDIEWKVQNLELLRLTEPRSDGSAPVTKG